MNAVFTAATTYGGFKTAGPAGAAAGLAIGSTASESARATVSSFMNFRKAKKDATDSGATAGGGGGSISASVSISQIKQTAASIASKVTEGDSNLVNAIGRIEEAIQLIALATDGSSSGTVQEMQGNANQVLAAAGEAQQLAAVSKEQISTWMAKI